MAVRVDINSDTLRIALETYLASLKRAHNSTKQPAFKPILEKDIAAVQAALGSITDLPEGAKQK